MTGVDILAVEQVATSYSFSIVTKNIILIIMLAFVISGIYFAIKDGVASAFLFACLAGAAVSLIIGGLVHEYTKKPIDYETRYKVLISDEVKLNDFYDKYEILEQDGKIFTVRDRKAD